jgi:hypothetical protein
VSVFLICRGYANGMPCPFDGMYLERYNPNGDERRGLGRWTKDKADAKRFATKGEAFELWRAVRTVDPVRPWDGKPNRPLTAFNVEITEVRDGPGDRHQSVDDVAQRGTPAGAGDQGTDR